MGKVARPSVDDVLGDAELVAIVGAINVEWDEIEFSLWYIFDTPLAVHWSRSYAIFFSQQNHRARREMVEALAEVSLAKGSARLRKIKSALGRIKRAAKRRSDISHGLWTEETVGARTEFHRMPVKRDFNEGIAATYSKADLKRLRDQLTKLRADLDVIAVEPWRKKNFPGETPSPSREK
jgi:hypothetical protein